MPPAGRNRRQVARWHVQSPMTKCPMHVGGCADATENSKTRTASTGMPIPNAGPGGLAAQAAAGVGAHTGLGFALKATI